MRIDERKINREAIKRKPRFSIVFVLGVARCGSTLLGRMLDMHSQVLCVGEMMLTEMSLDDGRTCYCGASIPECPFWKRYLPMIESVSGFNFRRFTPELYRKIASGAGKDVVVDLSKTLVWRLTKWLPNPRWWGERDVGYIFLVRDSRGVIASDLRGKKDKDFGSSFRRHKKWMRRLYRFFINKGDRAIIAYYEDICMNPEHEMRRLCEFIGIEFNEEMLNPADREHHLVRCSKSGYLKGENRIQLDERWRNELAQDAVLKIEKFMSELPFMRDRYLRDK